MEETDGSLLDSILGNLNKLDASLETSASIAAEPNLPDEKGTALVPVVMAVEKAGARTPASYRQSFLTAGKILTAPAGPLQIPEESRRVCALFETGLWLVSESHRNSPLIRSVASMARRLNYPVNEAQFVTPDVIQMAYAQELRATGSNRYDDNAIRRRIGEVIQAACDLRANDIHIEVSDGKTSVQFRVDGTLRVWENWTKREGELFLASVWSHTDVQSSVTANWNEPLAATISQKTGPDSIILPEIVGGMRCQWMPLVTGRYLNMRINYSGGSMLKASVEEMDVSDLGFNEEQTRLARHLRNVPGAMRIIAGPVNQGKTTTLRVMLNRRMIETDLKLNCLLIEDPPEGGVVGSRQIGVSSGTDENHRKAVFSEIMRASLRLDPDIVMLGEVRDFESATMAFRLALTGRQVFTSLHVYSALAIPQRVRDLGIETYLVYDHNLVRGLMAQRLGRTVCPYCSVPFEDAVKADPQLKETLQRARAGYALMKYIRVHGFRSEQKILEEPDLSKMRHVNVQGCEHCYEGRVGRTTFVELVEADAPLMQLLSENKMDAAKEYWLSPTGMKGISMLWHGLEKIQDGLVAPTDVEFELGPLASEKEVIEVEKILGVLP